ncbi:MAG: hypothetical protein ACRCYV_09420, partial [Aeromonas sp.]
MKKYLWLACLYALALPACAREFQLPGRTTWQLGQLMVNGIAFSIDEHTRFKAGLSADTLGGDWV